MRVLEIGSYLSVGYAGMVLAEQGHQVRKWLRDDGWDPVLDLEQGEELWHWLNQSKTVEVCPAVQVALLEPGSVDVVIDNIRAATWQRWGVNPARQARRLCCRWVSLRDDFDGHSFDVIAQARAWGDHIGYVPAYLGDTTAGLWLAFKALAQDEPGHFVLRQAALLAKLVEGELQVTPDRDGVSAPWDKPGTYGLAPGGRAVRALYRGRTYTEPLRDAAWRERNLSHRGGRITV